VLPLLARIDAPISGSTLACVIFIFYSGLASHYSKNYCVYYINIVSTFFFFASNWYNIVLHVVFNFPCITDNPRQTRHSKLSNYVSAFLSVGGIQSNPKRLNTSCSLFGKKASESRRRVMPALSNLNPFCSFAHSLRSLSNIVDPVLPSARAPSKPHTSFSHSEVTTTYERTLTTQLLPSNILLEWQILDLAACVAVAEVVILLRLEVE